MGAGPGDRQAGHVWAWGVEWKRGFLRDGWLGGGGRKRVGWAMTRPGLGSQNITFHWAEGELPGRSQLWRHRFLEPRTQPNSCQSSGTSALGILDSGGLPGSRAGRPFKFQNPGPSKPNPGCCRAMESWVCPANLGWDLKFHASRETQRGRWVPPRTTQCSSGPGAGTGMIPNKLGTLPALLAKVGGKGGLAGCLYWPGKLETGSYHLNPPKGGLETTGCGQREACQFPVSPRPRALGHRFVPRPGRYEEISGCASWVSERCRSSHRKMGTREQEGLTVIPGRGWGSGCRRSPSPQECLAMACTSSRGRRECRPRRNSSSSQIWDGRVHTPGLGWRMKVPVTMGSTPSAPPPPQALVSPREAPPPPKWWPWRSAWEGSSGQLSGAG